MTIKSKPIQFLNCNSDMTEASELMVVAETPSGKGTFTLRSFEPDEVLYAVEGEKMSKPSRYTIQIDNHLHIVPITGKFVNHSCKPNTYLDYKTMTFRALRYIKMGEEITFNYNSTEYEMAEPFECNCGSEKCAGIISGFKNLKPDQQLELQSYLPDYLLERLQELVI